MSRAGSTRVRLTDRPPETTTLLVPSAEPVLLCPPPVAAGPALAGTPLPLPSPPVPSVHPPISESRPGTKRRNHRNHHPMASGSYGPRCSRPSLPPPFAENRHLPRGNMRRARMYVAAAAREFPRRRASRVAAYPAKIAGRAASFALDVARACQSQCSNLKLGGGASSPRGAVRNSTSRASIHPSSHNCSVPVKIIGAGQAWHPGRNGGGGGGGEQNPVDAGYPLRTRAADRGAFRPFSGNESPSP